MLRNSVYGSDNVITEYICPYCMASSHSIKGQERHVRNKHPEKLEEFQKKVLHSLKP